MTTPFHFCASLESLPENTSLEAVLKPIASANIDGRRFTHVDLVYDPTLFGSSASIAEQAKYVADRLKHFGLKCRNVCTPFPRDVYGNPSECYTIMKAFADSIDFGQYLMRFNVRDQSNAHIIVRTPSFRRDCYEAETEQEATVFFSDIIRSQYHYLLGCHTEDGMIISPVDYCGTAPLKEIDKEEGLHPTPPIEHLVEFLFEETETTKLYIQYNFSSALNTFFVEEIEERSPDAIAPYFGYLFKRHLGSLLDIYIAQFSEFPSDRYHEKWGRGATTPMFSKISMLDLDAISKALASELKSSGFERRFNTLTWTFYGLERDAIIHPVYWQSALATLTGMEKSMQSILAGS